ncbi:hypothetical protein R6Q59_029566 [Mikania micrantha]
MEGKGVPIESATCPLCDDCNELLLNSFSSYFVASMIWQGISSWCNMQPIFAFSTKDLLELYRFGNRCRRKNDEFHTIVLAAL